MVRHDRAPEFLFPFAAMFCGIAQFAAGMWAFRARDGLATLLTLTVGSAFLAVFYHAGGTGWEHTGGWVLVASAICAVYTAGAMMIEGTFGRIVLPLGTVSGGKEANMPGERFTKAHEDVHGQPGVRQGQ